MTITWRTAQGLTATTDLTAPYAAQAWALPTGETANDLLIAVAGWKPAATGVTASGGWTAQGDQATASGQSFSAGTPDEGDVRCAVWSRVHDGSETAPDATPDGLYSPLMLACLAAYSDASGSAWTVQATSGSDDTATGTAVTVTGGSLSWVVGDYVVVAVVANSNATPSEGSAALAISGGVTIGTLTQQLGLNTTGTGDDGALSVFTAPITGAGTGAPTYTSVSGSSNDSHRAVVFLRVMEPAPSAVEVAATSVAGAADVPVFDTVNVLVAMDGESKQGVF